MKAIESHVVFEGKVFNVRQDTIERNGKLQRLDVVEHADSYTIIAQPTPTEVILVRQYRHAVGRDLWEFPAGMAEDGEDPKAGALRELREETGYRAGRIRQLHFTYMTPGFCSEGLYYFLAGDLTPGETQFDEDEDLETRTFSLEKALAMLRGGEIVDAKTTVGLLLLDGLNRQ